MARPRLQFTSIKLINLARAPRIARPCVSKTCRAALLRGFVCVFFCRSMFDFGNGVHVFLHIGCQVFGSVFVCNSLVGIGNAVCPCLAKLLFFCLCSFSKMSLSRRQFTSIKLIWQVRRALRAHAFRKNVGLRGCEGMSGGQSVITNFQLRIDARWRLHVVHRNRAHRAERRDAT